MRTFIYHTSHADGSVERLLVIYVYDGEKGKQFVLTQYLWCEFTFFLLISILWIQSHSVIFHRWRFVYSNEMLLFVRHLFVTKFLSVWLASGGILICCSDCHANYKLKSRFSIFYIGVVNQFTLCLSFLRGSANDEPVYQSSTRHCIGRRPPW